MVLSNISCLCVVFWGLCIMLSALSLKNSSPGSKADFSDKLVFGIYAIIFVRYNIISHMYNIILTICYIKRHIY